MNHTSASRLEMLEVAQTIYCYIIFIPQKSNNPLTCFSAMIGPMATDKITLRSLASERSLLTNCDGSARVRQGNSSALVGVWGPVDVWMSREDPEKAVVETTVKGATGHGVPKDKVVEQAVRRVCEQMILTSAHPRTSFQVNFISLLAIFWGYL